MIKVFGVEIIQLFFLFLTSQNSTEFILYLIKI